MFSFRRKQKKIERAQTGYERYAQLLRMAFQNGDLPTKEEKEFDALAKELGIDDDQVAADEAIISQTAELDTEAATMDERREKMLAARGTYQESIGVAQRELDEMERKYKAAIEAIDENQRRLNRDRDAAEKAHEAAMAAKRQADVLRVTHAKLLGIESPPTKTVRDIYGSEYQYDIIGADGGLEPEYLVQARAEIDAAPDPEPPAPTGNPIVREGPFWEKPRRDSAGQLVES